MKPEEIREASENTSWVIDAKDVPGLLNELDRLSGYKTNKETVLTNLGFVPVAAPLESKALEVGKENLEEIERLREEVRLLQEANDGLKTNVNLYAFRQRHFPDLEKERLRLAERLNKSSEAYNKLKAELSSPPSSLNETQEELWREFEDSYLVVASDSVAIDPPVLGVSTAGKDQFTITRK